jgi:hypothetical protein
MPLTLYLRRGSRDISDIPPGRTHFTKITYEKYVELIIIIFLLLDPDTNIHRRIHTLIFYIHTYTQLTVYPRRDSRIISNISPRHSHLTKMTS